MRKIIGIYGAGGFGIEVLPLVQHCAAAGDQILFIDDNAEVPPLPDFDVVSFERFRKLDGKKAVAIAIADGAARQRLQSRVSAAGLDQFSVVARNVIEGRDVEMGDGAIICTHVVLTGAARIGRCFHANIYSYVAHDCHIGDYVTFAPRVSCNGSVRIGDRAYIGTAAIIKQGLTIGADAIVGMGAVVTRDVPDGATVMGNPARIVEKKC